MANSTKCRGFADSAEPLGAAIEQCRYRLTAVIPVTCQILAPGADRWFANLGPVLAVPDAESDLGEGLIDVMHPTPSREPTTHIGAAPQG